MATGVGRVRGYIESAALYIAPKAIGTDLNIIPELVQPVQNCAAMACNVHRGDSKASYNAVTMGRNPALAAQGFFDVRYASWLQSGRYIFLAATGESFRIMSIPSVWSRSPRTAHVRVMLELCLQVPPGMPRYYYDTGYSYSVLAASGTDTYIPA